MDTMSVSTMSTMMMVVVVLVLLVIHIIMRRLGRMAELIEELQKKNTALQASLSDLHKKSLDRPIPVQETPLPAAPAPVAPVAVPVAAVPVAPVVTAEPVAASAGPAPEVVAAIMAALSVYGYSPEAIRSIRPVSSGKGRVWVLAGRLHNMRGM